MMLNTLSPTSKVFTAHEPQETALYLVHVNDYKGDMMTLNYKENGFIRDYKQYMRYTQYEAAYRQHKDAKTFKGHLLIGDTYEEDVLGDTFEEKDVLPMVDDTYKKDMLTVSKQENVVLMNAHKMYVKLTVSATTNQEDVDAEDNMMNNMNLFDDDQEGIKKTDLMYKRGTRGDAKRLAVSAIASRRGEKGA